MLIIRAIYMPSGVQQRPFDVVIDATRSQRTGTNRALEGINFPLLVEI